MKLIETILNNISANDLMDRNFLKVCSTQKIENIIKLMTKTKQNCIVIIINNSRDEVQKEILIDINDILNINNYNISIEDQIKAIKKKDYKFVKENDKASKILKLFGKANPRTIPVYNNSRIVGIISPNDIIKFYNELLSKTQNLFTKILDNIHDAICVVDKNANVIIWNESAENLYKIDKKKILEQKIQDVFPSALLPKVLADGASYENVFNSPRDGCYNIISAKPLIDDSGVIGAVSCDKDVSELIRMSELLSKTQSNLQVLENEVINLNEERFAFSQIISNDEKFKKIIEFSKSIAKSAINVLITGESGTGKEVFARAIHIESGRKGYFVPINCSAIPSELMESELFGYKSGAFTGASREGRTGKFELAHNGTIFLDEIGDMPLNMQPKILRVIEDGIITKVGSEKSVKIDVRIIAATNKDLKKLMDEGLFRKDLYYRLNSVLIELPPLRERKSDIPLLINKFIRDFCLSYSTNIIEIPKEIMDILINYNWEGNVRELKNLIERIVILSKHNKFDISYLPNDIINYKPVNNLSSLTECLDLNKTVGEREKELILTALELSKNNKRKAADLLNIPRSTLYFKMNKYGIDI